MFLTLLIVDGVVKSSVVCGKYYASESRRLVHPTQLTDLLIQIMILLIHLHDTQFSEIHSIPYMSNIGQNNGDE